MQKKVATNCRLKTFLNFFKTCKEITKQFGVHLTFKMADIQDVIYTTLANDFTVTIKNSNFSIPTLLTDCTTQVIFIYSIKWSFNFIILFLDYH